MISSNGATQQTIKFFENILRASSDGIVITDAAQNIIIANESFSSLFSQPVDSVLETSIFVWLEQLGKNYIKIWTQLEKSVHAHGKCQDIEFKFSHLTSEKYFSVNASLLEKVQDEDSGVIISLWRDITKRKHAGQKLLESKKTIQVLLEAIPQSAFLIDPEGMVLEINTTTAERLQSSADHLIGRCIYDYLPPDVAKRRKEYVAKAIRTEKPVSFEDVRKDIYIDNYIAPLCNIEGKVTQLAILGIDITERIKAEKEQLRAIANYTYDWESWLSPEGELKWVNPAVEKVTGYTISECLNMLGYPFPLVFEKDRATFREQLRLALEEQIPINDLDFRVNCKDQPVRWASASWQTIYDESGVNIGLRISVRDISDRKFAEAQVASSLKEKEVLLREIHHRVKNNMQVIISMLRMHTRKTNSPLLEQAFNDCRDRVLSMSLIHEALYQSKNLSRINFEEYLKKLCRNLSQSYGISKRGISLSVEKSKVKLNMDQGIAVGMVITELISNAFKHAFTDREGRSNVLVSLKALEEDEIELIISDNGKGLPSQIDIFKSPSLGLRLAVNTVKRELNGSIEVNRKKGTKYVIRF